MDDDDGGTGPSVDVAEYCVLLRLRSDEYEYPDEAVDVVEGLRATPLASVVWLCRRGCGR
jgi:hypothetical protein